MYLLQGWCLLCLQVHISVRLLPFLTPVGCARSLAEVASQPRPGTVMSRHRSVLLLHQHHAAPWQIHSRTGLLSQHRHGWVFFTISTSLVHICSMFSKRFSVSELRSYYHGLFFFCKNMTPYLLIDVAMNN